MTIDLITLIQELAAKHNIVIAEAEPFKQAVYNGNLTDTAEQVRDKIELAAKHYPGQALQLSTFETDQAQYAIVTPAKN